MLLTFMMKQAVEILRDVINKSPSTQSRAGITLSVDNSVIDRYGKLIRCTWSWYSGRWKKVVKGQDLLGIVLTVNGMAIPLHLCFCSKQGRANTDKPSLLIKMFSELINEFKQYDIELCNYPITMDSWFASEDLKKQLQGLGFEKIVVAGKGNYTFNIKGKKQKANRWKKEIKLKANQWGIDVPSLRVQAESPTFGKTVLLFFKKSSTRNFFLIDFSVTSLRGAEIWHIWKHHHLVEFFWKLLKSVFKIKSMSLRNNGHYVGLLVKVISYLFILRMKQKKAFLNLTFTEIMRKIQRDCDLHAIIKEHFQNVISIC